ncbi:IS5 family transposase [Streptomyces sp. CA-250714]|uniref:IS5 family transposase n=1 Tax=Streptomyces sp. CA-250714 TaxID=3240060 RepID=UPI003D949D21
MGNRPWIVDDELWVLIEPVLPPWPERAPGPRPLADRCCLQGILYMLYKNIAWQLLPPELGFGFGQTCWRRLGPVTRGRVVDALHRVLLTELHAADALDWTRACVDASHIRAKKEGEATGPSPVDRGKTGSKHHLICDGSGTPFKVITTAANVNDVTQTLPLADGIPPVVGKPGRPRRRPAALLGDKGYDSNPNRRRLRKRRILPVVSRKGAPYIEGLGKLRYVVEQTFSFLHHCKRLAVRWVRRLGMHNSLVTLACSLICFRHLKKA